MRIEHIFSIFGFSDDKNCKTLFCNLVGATFCLQNMNFFIETQPQCCSSVVKLCSQHFQFFRKSKYLNVRDNIHFFFQALYALLISGHMKRGESVLIHAGSGGVGQAAINLCIYYGCNIFTTVGTPEKREFIRQTFPQVIWRRSLSTQTN